MHEVLYGQQHTDLWALPFRRFQFQDMQFDEMSDVLGMKSDSGLTMRHPLAFLVEAADDICYHIIDLEDGAALGLVAYEEATELLRPLVPESFSWEKFKDLPSWKDGDDKENQDPNGMPPLEGTVMYL